MKSKTTVLGPSILTMLAIVVLMTAAAPIAFAQASHVRWDIVSFDPGSPACPPPGCVSPGGIATATAHDGPANDGARITLTGSGTFVAPSGGDGTSSAVSGGGRWTTYSANGDVTGTGTYEVTGLVRWDRSLLPPGGPPPHPADLIDPSDVRSSGLAVLRIVYSDGERGILVVSCESYLSPPTAYEGVHATKGLTDYRRPVTAVAGVNANRTLFHVEE